MWFMCMKDMLMPPFPKEPGSYRSGSVGNPVHVCPNGHEGINTIIPNTGQSRRGVDLGAI